MKTKNDPRHKIRISAVKALFEKSFRKDMKIKENNPAYEILKNSKKIDKIITKSAPAWPLSQLPPVDLATLRLAIWELVFRKNSAPYRVIVDEAVEIAKEYGSETSSSFVNGVLGTIIKSLKKGKTKIN